MGKVVFLGVEGSGKTTLAMALTKAFARHADEGWYLRPEGRGAYNFATIAPGDFATDGFPAQTSAAREMTWKISRDDVDKGGIQILDYPGEIYRLAFLTAEDEADPDAFRARAEANAEELNVLNRAIEEAESLYVLFNLQDALDLRGDDANRSAVWVTNECLKHLKALPAKPRVTLVFTQVDRYQTDDDFLHSFTPAELDLIGHDHPDVDWMMVSVLVPSDSEFGIDAFVRRVTGLGEFGVPDGRPRQRAAAGGALARLAAQRKSAATRAAPPADAATSAAPPADAATSAAPPAQDTPMRERSRLSRPDDEATHSRSSFLWLILITVIVFATANLVVLYFHGARGARALPRAATSAAPPADAATSAAPPADAATSAAPPADAATSAAPPAQDTPMRERSRLSRPDDAIPSCPRGRTGREERSRLSRPDDAIATNVPPAITAQAALSNEMAIALAAARACATPQEARETLSYAADALDSAEALYERARVDDLLGWGAFVRTREEKARNPPWPMWLRRIDLLGEKKAVVMLYPSVSNLAHLASRTQALEGYRAAAARGVPAAVDALARHASHENDKDVRRSEKTPAVLSAPPVPPAKSEVK